MRLGLPFFVIAATEAMGNGEVTEVLHYYHGEVTENASLLLVKLRRLLQV